MREGSLLAGRRETGFDDRPALLDAEHGDAVPG